jgi:hypothetical protein
MEARGTAGYSSMKSNGYLEEDGMGKREFSGVFSGLFHRILFMVLLLSVFMAGCEGGQPAPEPVSINSANIVNPTVTATTPANGDSGVGLNTRITATFSKEMNQFTVTTATFTLQQGNTPVSGTVTLAGTTATLAPSANLAPNTAYTATITTGARDLAGNALAEKYSWSFSTGSTPDTTAPTLVYVNPANGATAVSINQIITATFSEAMGSATINGTTFTLQQGATPVPGTVNCTGATATFTPSGNLTPDTTYTATITNGAKDLAGNSLAASPVPNTWSFTTAQSLALDTTAPTILSSNPANGDNGIAINSDINATFSEAMAPMTITTATFTVTGPPGTTPVPGTVDYDDINHIATFTPSASLALNATYTATVSSGATDLAGNPLASGAAANPWRFTTAATPAATSQAKVSLDAAATFGVLAGTMVANTGLTAVNGDLGVNPGNTVTGFPPGTVNGAIHTADAAAAQAQQGLADAYNDIAGRTAGAVVVANGELGRLTLPPGLYKSGVSSFTIGSADLTLDAQGDPKAIFIFQMPSSTLTVGSGRNVILKNGAKSSRIFWQVGSSATLGTGSVFKGSILAATSITLQSGATLDGRALARNGAVTLNACTITTPSP